MLQRERLGIDIDIEQEIHAKALRYPHLDITVQALVILIHGPIGNPIP